MGGNKAQTVGYRYSLGLHLALCHGPIDAIREILVDRRTAWSVLTGSGTSGGGAAVETRIGTVAGLSATPALAGDLGAAFTFFEPDRAEILFFPVRLLLLDAFQIQGEGQNPSPGFDDGTVCLTRFFLVA